MVNWSLVWHGLEITKHLRHPQLGTKGDMGWGWALLGFYSRVMSVSCQGHFKVNPDKILNKNMFLQFPYVFGCKGVFHKAAVDTVWMGSLPTRILGGGGGVQWPPGICGLEGWYPTLVWHGLEITKHLRHPQLGTKGDMGWGWALLGFYSRVMSVSCQGHFKVNPDKILNKNMFLQFPYVFGCKGVFHKAAVDTVWMGSLPTRILGGGGVHWPPGICGLEGWYPTLIAESVYSN